MKAMMDTRFVAVSLQQIYRMFLYLKMQSLHSVLHRFFGVDPRICASQELS
jgi:hypothetical protein